MNNKDLYSAMLVITSERAKNAMGIDALEPRDIYAEVMENLTACLRGDSNPTRATFQIWTERLGYCSACGSFSAYDGACTATYASECGLLMSELNEKSHATRHPHDPYVNGLIKEV